MSFFCLFVCLFHRKFYQTILTCLICGKVIDILWKGFLSCGPLIMKFDMWQKLCVYFECFGAPVAFHRGVRSTLHLRQACCFFGDDSKQVAHHAYFGEKELGVGGGGLCVCVCMHVCECVCRWECVQSSLTSLCCCHISVRERERERQYVCVS